MVPPGAWIGPDGADATAAEAITEAAGAATVIVGVAFPVPNSLLQRVPYCCAIAVAMASGIWVTSARSFLPTSSFQPVVLTPQYAGSALVPSCAVNSVLPGGCSALDPTPLNCTSWVSDFCRIAIVCASSPPTTLMPNVVPAMPAAENSQPLVVAVSHESGSSVTIGTVKNGCTSALVSLVHGSITGAADTVPAVVGASAGADPASAVSWAATAAALGADDPPHPASAAAAATVANEARAKRANRFMMLIALGGRNT